MAVLVHQYAPLALIERFRRNLVALGRASGYEQAAVGAEKLSGEVFRIPDDGFWKKEIVK
jgi:hypothetical protein